MQLGSIIPQRLKVRHHESSSMRSERDEDATGKLWKRSDDVARQFYALNNSVSQINRTVEKLRRRVIAPPTTSKNTGIQPFQIYAPQGYFALQIRGGLLGLRSSYFLGGGIQQQYYGNYEPLMVNDGTDTDLLTFDAPASVNSSGTNVYLPNNADIVINDSLSTVHPFQVIADSQYDSNGLIGAGFWLKIIDDPNDGFRAEMWGRMFTYGSGDYGRNFWPWPLNDPTTIPIGLVNWFNSAAAAGAAAASDTPYIEQYQTGNLTNIHSNVPQDYIVNNSLAYRGAWVGNDLSGQVFYTGDIVLDDSVPQSKSISGGGGGTFDYQSSFVYTGVPTILTQSPLTNPTGWIYFSSIIL